MKTPRVSASAGRAGSAALWPAPVLLAVYFAVYVEHAGRLVVFPFGVDQGEGYDAWAAWLTRLGQLPYTSNDVFPYFSSNYPPLWSALVALPMVGTGPTLASARGVSTAFALLAGLLVGLAAWRRARGTRYPLFAGLLAAGLFFASPYVFHTTPLARVNSAALAWSLLALSLVEAPTGWRLGAGTLALLAALLTKPTTVDAVVAGLAALWLSARRGPALQAAALLAAGGLVSLARLNAATGGAFWTNVVAANANPFEPEELLRYLVNFGALHLVVLVLAGIEVIRSVGGRTWSPWVCYLAASGLLSLSVGKWGAGESYYLGTIAAACVLAASGVARRLDRPPGGTDRAAASVGRRPPAPRAPAWLLGGALLVQMGLFAHGPVARLSPWLEDRGRQAEFLGWTPSAADHRAGHEITELIASVDGPVLSEEPSFLLAAGQPIIGNATHLRNLYQAGLWDPGGLVADVRRHRFSAVILNAELFPAPVLAAIGQSYYLVHTVNLHGVTYKVFLPGADG